ncbi:MAG: hypothetical protein U9O94_00705 [Nanoarchaeota archaeon]|nr:hypothetical protein [Nanoarchaeota archaeon]
MSFRNEALEVLTGDTENQLINEEETIKISPEQRKEIEGKGFAYTKTPDELDIEWDKVDVGTGRLIDTEATNYAETAVDWGNLSPTERREEEARIEKEREANEPGAWEEVKAFTRSNMGIELFMEIFDTVAETSGLNADLAKLGLAPVGVDHTPDPDFDPIEKVIGTHYEKYIDEFAKTENEAEYFLLEAKYDRENNLNDVIENGSWISTVSEMAGAVLDLPSLLPGGAIIKGARGTASVGKTILSTSKAGLMSGLITEGSLQATTLTRSWEESRNGVLAEMLLAGTLGGTLAGISKKKVHSMKTALEQAIDSKRMEVKEDLDGLEAKILKMEDGKDKENLIKDYDKKVTDHYDYLDSVGAMRVEKATLKDKTLIGVDGFDEIKGISKAKQVAIKAEVGIAQKLNPLFRLMTSGQKIAKVGKKVEGLIVDIRTFSQKLMEVPVRTKETLEGKAVPVSVEEKTAFFDAMATKALKAKRSIYTNFKKAVKEKRKAQNIHGEEYSKKEWEDLENMTELQFNTAIAQATRRGDVSPNKFVQEAAEMYRKEVLEPMLKEAIDVGLLPKGTKASFADSYLHRMWDKKNIVKHSDKFEAKIMDWAREKAEKIVGYEKNEYNKQVNNLQSQIDDLEMQTLRMKEDGKKEFQEVFKKVAREAEEVGDAKMSHLANQIAEMPEGYKVEDLLRDLKAINKGAKKPQGFVQFMIESGGVRDFWAELKHMGLSSDQVGLFNSGKRGIAEFSTRKAPKSMDDFVVMAQEEGFLPTRIGDEGEATYGINDVLELARKDFNEGGAFREADLEYFETLEYLDNLEAHINSLKLDFNEIKDVQLAKKELDVKKASKRVDKEVKKRVVDELLKANETAVNAKKARLKDKLTKTKQDWLERYRPYSDAEGIEDYAKEITRNVTSILTGADASYMARGFEVASRGPLAKRTLDIPDILVDGGDGDISFLVNDIDIVIDKYSRTMGADIELQRQFGYHRFEDMENTINDKYADAKEDLKTDKQREDLEAYRKHSLRDLQGVWDRVRMGGQRDMSDPDNMFARAVDTTKKYQGMTGLGFVLATSATDLGSQITKNGIYGMVKDALVPLVRDFKTFNATAKEAKEMNLITNTITNSRVGQLLGVDDAYSKGSTFERGMTKASDKFFKMTGLPHWNDFMQWIGSGVSQNRTIRAIQSINSGKAVKEEEITRLASLHIDDVMIERIGIMLDKYGGGKQGGVSMAGTAKWDDLHAKKIYQLALAKDVNSTIVVPGAGDIPLCFDKTAMGKLLSQFKTFTVASHSRVAVAGLQQQNSNFIQGITTMTAIGMFNYATRTIADGRELSDDPNDWLLEGIDRGGWATIPMLMNNTAEAVGLPGLSTALTGKRNISRLSNKRKYGALLGPVAGSIDRASTVMSLSRKGLFGDKDLTRGEQNALERNARAMVPFNQLIWWKHALDYALSDDKPNSSRR